jgi:hypothetical protein
MPDSTTDKFTSMSPIITRIQLQVFITNGSYFVTQAKCIITFIYFSVDENYPGRNPSEGWSDKNHATTTAVVVVVVVCGLFAMVVSCFVWKRRKNHLKDKSLSASAPSFCPSVPEAIIIQQPTPVTPTLPDYSVFR